MAINEQVSDKLLRSAENMGNSVNRYLFRSATHFSSSFLKGTWNKSKSVYRVSNNIYNYQVKGKYKGELTGKQFDKYAGERQAQNYTFKEVTGLNDRDLEKITHRDISKELSRRNVKFQFIENSLTGEFKVKMLNKDNHIFEDVRESLIKKLQKDKELLNIDKRHKIKDLLDSKYLKKDNKDIDKDKIRNKDKGIDR